MQDWARAQDTVAMVGMRASCQPIPVLIMVTPASSSFLARITISSHDEPWWAKGSVSGVDSKVLREKFLHQCNETNQKCKDTFSRRSSMLRRKIMMKSFPT